MNNKLKFNILLLIASLLLTLLLVEVVLNYMTKASKESSGVFLDIQLPPLYVLPKNFSPLTEAQRTAYENESFNSLVINEDKITNGDLWGRTREDPLIGYLPKENAVSTNGWWQTNNLGARMRQDITRRNMPDKTRWLFFGDSFTQGSRVPQEETFQHYINTKSSTIEAVNFGVDGYSLGQAYMRYTTLKDKLDYDHVFLVFVPHDDLWRDINVIRSLASDWESYKIMPRFIVEENRLQLITSPYRSLQELVDDNREYIGPKLRQHLENYDAFYFKYAYQEDPVLDWSVMYRLYKAYRHKHDRSRLRFSLDTPESEALQLAKQISENMGREVRENSARYSFVFLPRIGSIRQYAQDINFKKRWDAMVSYVCAGKNYCIDLMNAFQNDPPEMLDHGYDGTHYGPIMNSFVADFFLKSVQSPVSSH